ncbi:hypothetical protein SNL152K_6038 [Streptomyces sp. NL15-2K]|nr:hypothetical protein SNL152K_6038 [Streptomyces sp. NL15-2K]
MHGHPGHHCPSPRALDAFFLHQRGGDALVRRPSPLSKFLPHGWLSMGG